MAGMNLATLPRTAPTRFFHQEHHATMADLIQDIDTPTTAGTDHTPIMVPDIGDITSDHSPTPIYTLTKAAALEYTPYTLLPTAAAAQTTLQLIDVPVTPCAVIPTGIVASPLTFYHFSHRCQSCHSMDWSQSYSCSSHHTAQESQPRKFKQCLRPSTLHKPYCPKTVAIQDSPPDSSPDSDSNFNPLNY